MLRLLKLRPLVSSSIRTPTPTPTPTPSLSPRPPSYLPTFRSLPHLLLQRLPVSGTPKGKARLKNIAALKKSSFQKNKKSSSSSSSTLSPFDPRFRSQSSSRSLPRRLNAKLRRREAVREELGLVSKLRKRDLEVQRARKTPGGCPLMGLDGMDLVSLGYVDSPVPAFELTVKDGRTLATEYSRIMMHWNRLRQKAEGEAIELVRRAVEAMPEDLRKKVLVPARRKRKRKAAVVAAKGKGVAGRGGVNVMSAKKPRKKGSKKG